MSNPSTIWLALALPNPPIGSLPFVDTDSVSIITDVLNYFYTNAAPSVANGSICAKQLSVTGGLRESYTDTTGVPGAAIINKPAGRVKLAAGQSSLIVTNSYCFLSSIIGCQLEGAFDATATRVQVTVQANGSFTLTTNANATAAVVISFDILNVF